MRPGTDEGFSLIELLVAGWLTLLVCGAAIALASPAGHAANAQPDAIDMNQRLRVGAAAIARDVYMAGAGLDDGQAAGPLVLAMPPLLPRRIGASAPDAFDTARPDVVSILWVPDTVSRTALAVPMPGSVATTQSSASCPPGWPACGFQAGMGMIAFDGTGRFDLFTVTGVQGPDVLVRQRGVAFGAAYRAGSAIAELRARTYYHDPVTQQLRSYDTDLTDSPAIDDVTRLAVEYYGTTAPPLWPKPPLGEANCLYDAAGSPLVFGPILAPGPGGQAVLPLSMFTDGPWCGLGGTAFDLDLLRIRRVRITLGVQASAASHRARGGAFQSSGTSRSAWRNVEDLSVTFDVSPRNLSLVDEVP